MNDTLLDRLYAGANDNLAPGNALFREAADRIAETAAYAERRYRDGIEKAIQLANEVNDQSEVGDAIDMLIRSLRNEAEQPTPKQPPEIGDSARAVTSAPDSVPEAAKVTERGVEVRDIYPEPPPRQGPSQDAFNSLSRAHGEMFQLAVSFRDTLCRVLDTAERRTKAGKPLEQDEIDAMTARLVADTERLYGPGRPVAPHASGPASFTEPHSPCTSQEPMYFVAWGSDGHGSVIVPESKLETAYLETLWGDAADAPSDEREEALALLRDPDNWIMDGDTKAVWEERLEDGWCRIYRMSERACACLGVGSGQK